MMDALQFPIYSVVYQRDGFLIGKAPFAAKLEFVAGSLSSIYCLAAIYFKIKHIFTISSNLGVK